MFEVYSAVLLFLGFVCAFTFASGEEGLGFIFLIMFVAALVFLPYNSTTTKVNQNEDCQWIKNDYKGVVLCDRTHKQVTDPYLIKNFTDTSKVEVEVEHLVSLLDVEKGILVYEAP